MKQRKTKHPPRRILRLPHPDAEEPGDLTQQQLDDWRWATVLDQLQQHNDPRELVKAIIDGLVAPPEVREELGWWLTGKLPPQPRLSRDDWDLLLAAEAYRRSHWQEREKREHKIARIAEQRGVSERALQSVLDGGGHVHSRIQQYKAALRKLGISVMVDPELPSRSRRRQ